MTTLIAPGFVLLLISISIAVGGQIFFKLGAPRLSFTPEGLLSQFSNVPLILGFSLYLLSAVIYVTALKTVPLSVAYPTLALGYIVVVVISVIWLGETFTVVQSIGAVLICAGIALLWR
jgi:multidrug transporter EmrE-like cation transporter